MGKKILKVMVMVFIIVGVIYYNYNYEPIKITHVNNQFDLDTWECHTTFKAHNKLNEGVDASLSIFITQSEDYFDGGPMLLGQKNAKIKLGPKESKQINENFICKGYGDMVEVFVVNTDRI